MQKIARQIVTIICLVALICGGQFNVCACEMESPKAACGSHDHSDHHESSDSDNSHSDSHSDAGCDSACPCATCHSCHHAQVVLPGSVMNFGAPAVMGTHCEVTASPSVRPADIFDPPKLS